ncbi:Imm32 family immunity protein [Planctomicrobium piriforme]|uniref:Uncharacterized protein n=1 Tax=Planctomicrobium piriforme TaxID=1576369 RepID=A0A1I3JZY6_9PLAN|nr:hypothetical protein [Planctomicrobium piriforme]SFI65724.1 hypothetical protein SAMN05421753_11171 [Planctomicrobium piriforme]
MEPEVIVKLAFLINATGDVGYAVPEIHILGNKAGLLQLANALRSMAESVPRPDLANCDPDDHRHFGTQAEWDKPFNNQLSDELEFRLGILTEENRDLVLQKYRITPASRATGSLVARYRSQADAAEKSEARVTSAIQESLGH